MLAARWSDYIRQDNRYNRPKWHYINFPHRANNELDLVAIAKLDPENILTANGDQIDKCF